MPPHFLYIFYVNRCRSCIANTESVCIQLGQELNDSSSLLKGLPTPPPQRRLSQWPFYFLILFPLAFSLLTPLPSSSVIKQPFFGAVTCKYHTSMIEFITRLLILSAILIISSFCGQQPYSHPEFVSILPSQQVISDHLLVVNILNHYYIS